MARKKKKLRKYTRRQKIQPDSTTEGVFRRRKATLESATAAVCGDRHLNYGSAEDNFGRIADLYNSWVRIRKTEGNVQTNAVGDAMPVLTRHDVTVFNILQKLARLANTPAHFDSWADIAGYAACGAECSGAEKPE